MSRFRIRRRLGRLLGRSQAPVRRFPVHLVLPDGAEHTVEAEERYTLVMASQLIETPIATDCPDGACGRCVVQVVDGAGLSPPTDKERRAMAERQEGPISPEDGLRLACHARVVGPGVRVRVAKVWRIEDALGD